MDIISENKYANLMFWLKYGGGYDNLIVTIQSKTYY
jgi:hypothetical protein